MMTAMIIDVKTWKICETGKASSVDVVQFKKCGGAVNLQIKIKIIITEAWQPKNQDVIT